MRRIQNPFAKIRFPSVSTSTAPNHEITNSFVCRLLLFRLFRHWFSLTNAILFLLSFVFFFVDSLIEFDITSSHNRRQWRFFASSARRVFEQLENKLRECLIHFLLGIGCFIFLLKCSIARYVATTSPVNGMLGYFRSSPASDYDNNNERRCMGSSSRDASTRRMRVLLNRQKQKKSGKVRLD